MPDAEALWYGLDLLKISDTRGVLVYQLKVTRGKYGGMVTTGLAKDILKVNPGFQVESVATAANAPFCYTRINFNN